MSRPPRPVDWRYAAASWPWSVVNAASALPASASSAVRTRRGEGPRDRSERRGPGTLGQEDRGQRDERARADGQEDGAPAGEQERHDDPDDHHERQRQRDQRADAAPAADERDRGGEETEDRREGRGSPAIRDRDQRHRLAGRDRDDHLVAGRVGRQVLGPGRPFDVAVEGRAGAWTIDDRAPTFGAPSPASGRSASMRPWASSIVEWPGRRRHEVRQEPEGDDEEPAGEQRPGIPAQADEWHVQLVGHDATLPAPRPVGRAAHLRRRWDARRSSSPR